MFDVKCPDCSEVLGAPQTHIYDRVCPACRLPVRFLCGEAAKKPKSKGVVIQRKTKKREGQYSRDYEVELRHANGQEAYILFSIGGEDDVLQLERGQELAFPHVVKDRTPHLVGIQTFGLNYALAPADLGAGRKAAVVAGLGGMLLTWMLLKVGAPGAVAWCVAGALSFPIFNGVLKVTGPRLPEGQDLPR